VTRTYAFERMLARPGHGPAEDDVVVTVEDSRIAAIESGVADGAGTGRLAVPALVNAHDHGFGLRPVDFGVLDDALEPWIAGWGLRPQIDPYLETLVAFGRMARAGIGATIHCHNSHRADRMVEETAAVVRAARDVGIRLGLSCPILDRNSWVYGGPEALRPFLSDADWNALSSSIPVDAPAEVQIARVDEVAAAHESSMVCVQYGPVGPQWCQDRTLELIAEASAQNERRVHMHLLESKRQREWFDHVYPDGVLRFFDKIGLLTPRLAVAHGVWLREEEAAMLAERGVTVVSNPSSNLRLRSGVAPLGMLLRQGVEVAFGLDGTGLDDDQDLWRELRLANVLQGGTGLEPEMPVEQLFDAALLGGARVIDGASDRGVLQKGRAADFAVIDLNALTEDLVLEMTDLSRLLLARMTAARVSDLMVAGEAVLADRRLVNVDFEAAQQELRAQSAAASEDLAERHRKADCMREAIRAYYAAGAHLQDH